MTIKPNIKRVVVTGGRNFSDGARIEADLRALLSLGLERVAEGGAPGADDLAYDAWHLLRNESTERYHVKLLIDGPWPAAGPRRNVRMLEAEQPDLVLAYPDEDSRGTWRCIEAALARGVSVAVWHEGIDLTTVASFSAHGALHMPATGPVGFAPAFIRGASTARRTYWIARAVYADVPRGDFQAFCDSFRNLLPL